MSKDQLQMKELDALKQGAAADVDVDAEHKPETARNASNAGLRREAANVQKKGDGAAKGDTQAIAAQGVQGAGEQLPHHDRIQASFGKHDVSGIKAHQGSQAAQAANKMGAEAYATGDSVAFGKSPDLHTAAHEAAHVVQQKQGVSLKGGVGAAGDAHEKNADEVADRVVAGKSAEDLLGAPSNKAAPAAGVQMKPKEKHEEEKKEDFSKVTEDDKKAEHTKAESATYQGMISSIRLTTKRMHNAAASMEGIRKADVGDRGSDFIWETIRKDFDGVETDVQHLAGIIGKTGPMLTEWTFKNGFHEVFREFWGGLEKVEDAVNHTGNDIWARNEKITDPSMKIPSLGRDPKKLRDLIADKITAIDGRYAEDKSTATHNDKGGELADVRDVAVTKHAAAAKEAVHAIRMGDSNNLSRLKLHVNELLALVQETASNKKEASHLKKHKTELLDLLKEVKSLKGEKDAWYLKDLESPLEDLEKYAKNFAG
jgi:hypothetical protein